MEITIDVIGSKQGYLLFSDVYNGRILTSFKIQLDDQKLCIILLLTGMINVFLRLVSVFVSGISNSIYETIGRSVFVASLHFDCLMALAELLQRALLLTGCAVTCFEPGLGTRIKYVSIITFFMFCLHLSICIKIVGNWIFVPLRKK